MVADGWAGHRIDSMIRDETGGDEIIHCLSVEGVIQRFLLRLKKDWVAALGVRQYNTIQFNSMLLLLNE